MIQIILSTYNGSKYIVEQLVSIINQKTSFEFEILIRDDGSSDNTVDLVLKTFVKYNFTNYKLEKGLNIGYMQSYTKLIRESSAKYLLFSDQDDIWHEDKIEYFANTFKALEKEKKHIVLFSEMHVFGKLNIKNYYKTSGVSDFEDQEKHFLSTYIAACSMGINDQVKHVFLKFIDVMGLASHDTANIMIGVLSNGLHKIDTPLFYYRIHSKNTCGLSFNKDSSLTKMKIWAKYIFQNKQYRLHIFDEYYFRLAKSLKQVNLDEPFVYNDRGKYLDVVLNLNTYSWTKRKLILLRYNIFPGKTILDKLIRLFCI